MNNIQGPINILSLAPSRGIKTGGPGKVFYNLCKGLDRLNVTYVINQKLDDYKYNWIQSSIMQFIEASIRNIPAVVGPNLFTLPNEMPSLVQDASHLIYLQPSEWPIKSWKYLGYKTPHLRCWPVGIDWEDFSVKRGSGSKKVLLYFKRRSPEILNRVVETLKSQNLEPIILKYGSYNEKEFKLALSESFFGIWIGVSESQGIGLQEALASNLPLIVMDVNSFWDEFPKPSYPFPKKLNNFKPTSAPYFSKECGIIINTIDELHNAVANIMENYKDFEPVNFIKNHLSLEKSALAFLDFFDELNFNEEPKKNDWLNKLIIKSSFFEYKIRNKKKTIKNKFFQ